jgi:small-conductance mechanosensitive channel
MNKLVTSIVFVIFILIDFNCFAQQKAARDSASSQSKNQADASILYQQRIMDSLVKVSLQNELLLSVGNSAKTRELEDKLNKLREKDSLSQVELIKKINLLKKTAKGYAIVPFNDTLFLVYNKSATFSAAERAENIENKIKKIYADPFFNPDSLQVTPSENGSEISYYNDIVVMVVTKTDAMLLGKDEHQLALEYRGKIASSILDEQKANSLTNWLIRIGYVLLIVAGLWMLIFLINKIFRWANLRLTSNRDKFLSGLTLNKISFFTPEHFEKFILRASNLLRIAVIILTVYLSLPLLFYIFPETKTWTATLLGWILSPARIAVKGVIGFLPNLFSILVIVFIFKYAIRGIKYFVDQIEEGGIQINGFHADWAYPTFRILKFLLFAFMLVLIFPYLPGSSSPAFQGVSVFIGILFSLGSSSAIANMVAGMVITYMRPFKIGDRVKIGDITGDVVEKTTLVTRIRTIKNEDVTVPNSTVLLSSTTNYSTNTKAPDNGLIVHTAVSIGYDVPWREVHQALIASALRTDMILKKPVPFVLQTSLDDFYVTYQINAFTRHANDQVLIYSLLHQNIQDCFNEAGIEILSPHYRSLRDGNTTAMPADYLPEDYQAPAFGIKQKEDKQTPATKKKGNS